MNLSVEVDIVNKVSVLFINVHVWWLKAHYKRNFTEFFHNDQPFFPLTMFF